MREVVALVSSGTYKAGAKLRLYGPDDDGVLDTSAFEATGRAAVHPGRSAPDAWLEVGWLSGCWMDARRRCGWLRGAWLKSDWLREPALLALRGGSFEQGMQEHAVAAVDAVGNPSATGATGSVFVNASPARPAASAIAVAAGVVTVTITEGA